MSLAALVVGHVLVLAVAREAGKGTAAHLSPLIIGGQLPVVAFFAIKWLPRAPRQALLVLVLQALAGSATLAPDFFLNL